MIEPGDKVLVAISGGKDSIVMMKILAALKEAAPLEFELIPVHVKTGYEVGFERVSAWIREDLGYEVLVSDGYISQIMEVASDPGKSPCALCSRLRRGKIYGLADEMGVASIALGHHMDDIIETFLLRCLYTGQLGAMSPARRSDDGKNRIIRPLAYCPNELITAYYAHLEIEPVEIRCPIRPDSKRGLIRDFIKRMENDIPSIKHSMFAALGNIDMKSLCIKEKTDADRD
jgi:tRNA 2-thiocytidine biosynthesis protein TtcA